jgi:hypothetical protein
MILSILVSFHYELEEQLSSDIVRVKLGSSFMIYGMISKGNT